MEETKVRDKAKALSGHEPGQPKYFAEYQNALSAILEGLSSDELEEYDRLAAEWNLLGCPPAAQQKNWKKNGRRFLQTVSKTAWEQYGIRLIMCVNVKDADGVRVMNM